MEKSIEHREITKIVDGQNSYLENDILAVEEPLQIVLTASQQNPPIIKKNISVTMRTPGDDDALSVGFLFTEGIIQSSSKIKSISSKENQTTIEVEQSATIDISKLQRNFYTTSSCGVCGKSSLEAVRTICEPELPTQEFSVTRAVVLSLSSKMRRQQNVFQNTGGLHAVGLFDRQGTLIMIKEDVGRHNALDKVIGSVLLEETASDLGFPLSQHILLLSGRASFELIQKSVMAGIKVVVAIGSPSSMAVALAEDHNITLIGFLKKANFNIYTGAHRIT